jgi:hypothetical protein
MLSMEGRLLRKIGELSKIELEKSTILWYTGKIMEESMSNWMSVIILSVNHGTASGWDGDPGEAFWVYDFEPNDSSPFIACECLHIDYNKGVITAQDNEGNSLQEYKLHHEWKAVPVNDHIKE